MILHGLDKHRDKGLLILRIGIGICFILHGWPKISTPDKWAWLGSQLPMVDGGTFASIMGFMAAFAEFGGGIMLLLGLFTRPACFLMLNTMIVATYMHVSKGYSFMKYSHALEAGILFLSLLFIGPGAYSLDDKFAGKSAGPESER